MRRWQNLAAPDDPGSWYDVDGFWPTKRATYERVHFGVATNLTATGAGTVVYAFVGATLTGSVEYVVDTAKLWQYSGGTLTDRTNGVTIGSYPMMVQYGNVTICVMGASAATCNATGGNFSALAGAPNGEIVVAQSNAVLIFNTNAAADGWAASDVGDYTNWTTGEAASGRLIQTPGPITAAVTFGDSVIVFKPSSIYRMRYVGGAVKWAVELLHPTIGCSETGASSAFFMKYAAAASAQGVLFHAPGSLTLATSSWRWMNGAGQFTELHPLTTISTGAAPGYGGVRYCPDHSMFAVYGAGANHVWFYNEQTDMWGRSTAPNAAAAAATAALGVTAGNTDNRSPMPTAYYKSAANVITRYSPSATTAGKSCYIETAMLGKPNRKTKFLRCIPILRRRADLGTDSAALSVTRFRELHDTSAANTDAVTESTQRKRFDMTLTDNFARFKVTFTDLDVEVDDFLIDAADAGRD